MRASLDGLSFAASTVLEIKCPRNMRDQSAAQRAAAFLPPTSRNWQHELGGLRAEEAIYW